MNQLRSIPTTRRGSTMILVVAMLVLLVIIAAAFVARAQSLRVLASAQQLSAAQTDRIGPIAHAVSQEVAQSLFVRPINPADAALVNAAVAIPSASPAVPRGVADYMQTRYAVDPTDRLNNSTLLAVPDGVVDGYNFAPFEVRPWTNWPDVYNLSPAGDIRLAEANPIGNPSFGDCRWLRSTEPVRVVYQGQPAFSHWAHLSWIPTANNGWRLVTDISDIAKNTLTEVAPSQKPVDFFPTPAKRWALEVPYEQWLPSVPPDPNLWIPITIGAIPATPPVPPFPNASTPQGDAALVFQQLAFGTTPVTNPAGGWFSSAHRQSLASQSMALPNFLRLKWFGPKSDEFFTDSPRNIITRTLCDTDGDGFTDSFWFVAPSSLDRSIRHVVGVSVVDNSALLNVNIATRFDPATTGGKTPSDLALVDRLSLPSQIAPNTGVGFATTQFNTASANAYQGVTVALDQSRFGSPTSAAALADNRFDPTILSELGVVTTATLPAATAPFGKFLQSDLERITFFKAMNQGGEVEGYFNFGANPIALTSEGAWNYGMDEYLASSPAPATAVVRTNSQAPAILNPFTMADELELRAFAGHNNPYVRSRLERAFEKDRVLDSTATTLPTLADQFLRSSMEREETSELFDQLDARQLLFDNRRKLTTVSGARNEMMPPWLWTLPPASSIAQQPGQPGTWPANAIRGWKHLYSVNYGIDYSTFQSVPPQGGPNYLLQFPAEPGAVVGDGNCDGNADINDVNLARSQFLEWNRKVDLNRELNDDNVSAAQNLANQHDLARDVLRVLQRSLFDIDSKTSIFGQEFDQAQPNYNRNALAEARRAALSWTANIIAASDGPRKFPGMIAATDPPLHPDRGLIVQEGGVALSFIGQEKHPFIVQVFFAVVYPKTGVVPQGVPGAGASYVTFDPNNASDGARVVLAVQIANPYNEPIDLWPYRLRAFGQEFSFLQVPTSPTDGKWGYGTFPVLGPATEEQPRSAIVFAIPKALGSGASVDPNFRVHMMNFLDLSHPWQRPSGFQSGAYPKLLATEVGQVPTEFFPVAAGDPLNGHDLFEDSTTAYPDTLVFNASQVSAAESVDEAGSNKWSVKPKFYIDKLTGAVEDRDIALVRLVADPLIPAATARVVVDRLENQYLGTDTQWSDQLARILTPPQVTDVNNGYVPPKYVAPDPGSASQQFAHVDIGASEFLMSWIRVSRPWTLDVDKNGAITANERSPRFVFAYNSNPLSVGVHAANLIPLVGPKVDFRGETFTVNDLKTKADGIALSSARTPFNTTARGKPTNFTLKTVLNGSDRIYGTFNEATGAGTWPGTPAATAPTTIFGDTGAGFPTSTLDFYQHPIRMTQRDGPFEQIAEIYDVPVWGPVMKQTGATWNTFATYGEMMVGAAAAAGGTNPTTSSTSTPSTTSTGAAGFPTFGADSTDQRDTMRFQFARDRSSVKSVVGFVPPLPGGASILDGFTLDAAGSPRVDVDGDGSKSPNELLAAEQRRLRLAGGFKGVATQGLININTAPIEVMRALPNMQQLSYNSESVGAIAPNLPPVTFVQLPETIVNYRDRLPAVVGFPPGPKYDDRGFAPVLPATELFPFHPGMRGERGFVSVGELALLDRVYRPSSIGTATEPDPEALTGGAWNVDKSWSVAFAGLDPYRTQEDPAITTPPTVGHTTPPPVAIPSDVGSGWRAPVLGGRYSSQLATERLAQNLIQYDLPAVAGFNPLFAVARTAGDQVERNTMLKGIANLVTTRSDIFTVYLKVRSVAQNSATGIWDATNPETLIDESRYIMVIDRSQVNRPGDEPKILMFEKIVE